MSGRVERQAVDFAAYPDLVVIYLGMRAYNLRGLKTLLGFGPRIARSVADKPAGLLLHENLLFSLVPPHAGMRQYWRDFESLEQWARSLPHLRWWQDLVRDPGGTGFWHETYALRGGMEAIFIDMGSGPAGLLRALPVRPAQGTMFTARRRLGLEGESPLPPGVAEES